MNYMDIRPLDVSNGIGIRVSLFVSGCSIHCKDCFNKEAWDFNAGKEFASDTFAEIFRYMDNPHVAGLSILGGDPIDNILEGNHEIIALARAVKRLFPDKTIFVWTGHVWEDIISNDDIKYFLKYVDMLRDGPFIQEKKDLMQYLEGSTNQRSIDVQKTLKTSEIHLYNFKDSI